MRAHSSLILQPSSLRHRGYSFTEVMFAVVVLGIGFIMIAAMFPVAIQQTATTNEESIAAAIARGAVQYISTIADRHTMRPTDTASAGDPAPMRPFTGIYTPPVPTTPPPAPAMYTIAPPDMGSWQAVKGNLIQPSDTRYAYVPLYSRETGSQFARLSIIVVRVRDRSTYDATDITPDVNANLQARLVNVNVQNNVDASGVDWVTFTGANLDAVSEGTYVVISNHAVNGPTPIGHYNGQVFRVGVKATVTPSGTTPPADTWELSPGNDFSPDAGADDLKNTGDDLLLPATAIAYIVGRERDPATPADFRGVAQDVSYYTTFIQVKP